MDAPPFDRSRLPLDLRRHLRHAVEAHCADPEPTPAELLLANGPRRVDDWALHTNDRGLPQLMVLPEPDLDPRLGDHRGTPIAARPDGVVRLRDGTWVRLGAPSLPKDPLFIEDELDTLQACCAALADALLAEPPWAVAQVPATLRRTLGLAMLHASTGPPPSPTEWRAATAIRGWTLDRDRWRLPLVRGLAEGAAGPPWRVEVALWWVWEPASGGVVLAPGLARLADHATLDEPGAVTALLEWTARECVQLRDALLGEDEA